ncbi:MAG TPA: hypothetical protein VLW53_19845 [Candidatus Eisenbacteria bacterium]|nr:hypothetical protein [Candidatus Eisenbacteria bacterium]
MSLFDRLGGAPAIIAAAELFYRQVLADPLLALYFDDVDMGRQVAKQAAFLTMALGGPGPDQLADLRLIPRPGHRGRGEPGAGPPGGSRHRARLPMRRRQVGRPHAPRPVHGGNVAAFDPDG